MFFSGRWNQRKSTGCSQSGSEKGDIAKAERKGEKGAWVKLISIPKRPYRWENVMTSGLDFASDSALFELQQTFYACTLSPTS